MNKTTTDACLDLLFSQCFALYCTAVKVFYCFKCCKAFNTCRHWNFRPNNFFWVSEMSFLINVYEIGMLLYCKWYMNIMYKGRFHSYYKIETNKIYRYMYRYIMLQVNTFDFFLLSFPLFLRSTIDINTQNCQKNLTRSFPELLISLLQTLLLHLKETNLSLFIKITLIANW